jgi:hypothetical protein
MKHLKERLSIRMAICVHGTSEIRKKIHVVLMVPNRYPSKKSNAMYTTRSTSQRNEVQRKNLESITHANRLYRFKL